MGNLHKKRKAGWLKQSRWGKKDPGQGTKTAAAEGTQRPRPLGSGALNLPAKTSRRGCRGKVNVIREGAKEHPKWSWGEPIRKGGQKTKKMKKTQWLEKKSD